MGGEFNTGGDPTVQPSKHELPPGFAQKMLEFRAHAPDVGSPVERYIATQDVRNLYGYLRGFNTKWVDGYLFLHDDPVDEERRRPGLLRLVAEAEALAAEIEPLYHAVIAEEEAKHPPDL